MCSGLVPPCAAPICTALDCMATCPLTPATPSGMTLHQSLAASRESVPEVPAVYFARPSDQAIQRIAQDAGSQAYKALHVNWTSAMTDQQLQAFAQACVRHGGAGRVASVHDQCCDFVTLESDMFTLGVPGVYHLTHAPGVPDAQVMAAVDRVVQGLFNLCCTASIAPYVASTSVGVASEIARRLCGAISEDAQAGSPRLTMRCGAAAKLRRPLLVLADRDYDLAAGLAHSASYMGLIEDTVGLAANRVTLPAADSSAAISIDLDSRLDPFWAEHARSAFPDAIEANGQELEAVSAKESELRRRAGDGGAAADAAAAAAAPADLASTSAGGVASLADAVDSLPALLERKKRLELHTKLMEQVMLGVAARQLPRFFEAEASLSAADVWPALGLPAEEVQRLQAGGAGSAMNLATVSSGIGSWWDRVRLACIAALSSDLRALTTVAPDVSGLAPVPGPAGAAPARQLDAELCAVLRASAQAGTTSDSADAAPRSEAELAAGLAALHFVSAHRASSALLRGRTAAVPSGGAPGARAAPGGAGGSHFFSSFTSRTQALLGSQLGANVGNLLSKAAASVKQLVGAESHRPIAKFVHAVLDQASGTRAASGPPSGPTGSITVLDALDNGKPARPGAVVPSSGVIVFAVGGGNQSEAQELFAWAQGAGARDGRALPLLYGTDDVVTPMSFVQGLAELQSR